MGRARGPNRITRLKTDYEAVVPTCHKLAKALKDQLDAVVLNENLKLAAEPESRIKSLESIEGKLKRKGRRIDGLDDLHDVVGLRYVFLFTEDADLFSKKITELLTVLEHQDARERLPTSHFGYRSDHYVVRIPSEWSKLPAYSGLGDMTAEIQVRTMAQHLWAVASHLLQYKSEDSVPAPLKRSLSRVAALLEVVDAELSRVRTESSGYERAAPSVEQKVMTLDEMVKVVRDTWPSQNKDVTEEHPELYAEIISYGITAVDRLKTILQSEQSAVMEYEQRMVRELSADIEDDEEDFARLRKGVYFTHVGLTRIALQYYFATTPRPTLASSRS